MTNKRLEKLEEIVKGKRVLILVHNNPDPDAIAAGWALSYLLKKKFNMCEIPSNVILADQFARRFDGFSIGSNDLTQLVLDVDRDSAELAPLFDERNEAIKKMIQDLIKSAHKASCKVGICGQAPSDYPDFATFLVKVGIDSISLNPDSVIEVKQCIARIKKKKRK
jgi:pyruvate,water dikinase